MLLALPCRDSKFKRDSKFEKYFLDTMKNVPQSQLVAPNESYCSFQALRNLLFSISSRGPPFL
jgi:hypothetical protein